MIYLIGSLRNPRIPEIAQLMRANGLHVFDDWYAAGPEADDHWQAYETARGRTFADALQGHAARHVFRFDAHHLRQAKSAVLVLPAGKSGHLELGVAIGMGKPGFVLYDQEPERWDVMYQFADRIFFDPNALIAALKGEWQHAA